MAFTRAVILSPLGNSGEEKIGAGYREAKQQ